MVQPDKCATARNIAGPWPDLEDIARPETKNCGAQSTILL